MALIVYVHLKVHFEGSSTPTPNKSNNDHHRGENGCERMRWDDVADAKEKVGEERENLFGYGLSRKLKGGRSFK